MLYLILVLLCSSVVQKVSCLEESFDREFVVIKNEFSVVIVNFSHSRSPDVVVSSGGNDREFERYSIIVQPDNAADLPSNWNYLVRPNGETVIIYGTALEEDRDYLDLMILRYDLTLFINSSSMRIRLVSIYGPELVVEEQSSGNKNPISHHHDELMGSEQSNLELGFHKIDLGEFLMSKAKLVDSLMHRILWPGSKLARVSSASNGSVQVRIIGPKGSGQNEDQFVAQLEAEVWRATRGGQSQLCKFKESKTISVEHYFRRLDLYPNWCMLKVIRFKDWS